MHWAGRCAHCFSGSTFYVGLPCSLEVPKIEKNETQERPKFELKLKTGSCDDSWSTALCILVCVLVQCISCAKQFALNFPCQTKDLRIAKTHEPSEARGLLKQLSCANVEMNKIFMCFEIVL